MVPGVLLRTSLWAGVVTKVSVQITTIKLNSYRNAARWAFSVQGNVIDTFLHIYIKKKKLHVYVHCVL
jgi:hypothetical protein